VHVDPELSEDFRLLAVADHDTGIVGDRGQVQARQLGAAQIRLAQLRPVPFDAIEGARSSRASLRSVSMKEASESLQERNSQRCRKRPERSAKLRLQRSNEPLVRADRREIVRVKLDCRKCAPRKLESGGREAIEVAAFERARGQVALGDLGALKVAEGEGAALARAGIEEDTALSFARASLQLASRIGSNRHSANDEPEKSVLRIVAA
jgi:hypothetical protein